MWFSVALWLRLALRYKSDTPSQQLQSLAVQTMVHRTTANSLRCDLPPTHPAPLAGETSNDARPLITQLYIVHTHKTEPEAVMCLGLDHSQRAWLPVYTPDPTDRAPATTTTHMCLDCSLELRHTPLVAGQRSKVRAHVEEHPVPHHISTVHRFLGRERGRGWGPGILRSEFISTCSSSCQVVTLRISCRRNASSEVIFCSSSSNSGSTVCRGHHSHCPSHTP